MQNIIDIKNLNVFFEDKIIFSDFSLKVYKGERLGLFAPTGKGKTTLLNKIAEFYYDKIKISYSFQENCVLQNKSVEKNIAFVLNNKNKQNIDCILKDFDLYSKKNVLCKFLSGGELQRVNLARAFAFNGELFLLDEPFSAQDNFHKSLLLNLIEEKILNKNKTLIIVSHNYDDLKSICTKIIEL